MVKELQAHLQLLLANYKQQPKSIGSIYDTYTLKKVQQG